MKSGSNRRRFLRVRPGSLFAEISIVSADSRSTSTGSAIVDISDIGTGGLRFISYLDIPEDREIVLKFNIRHDEQETLLYGIVLRKAPAREAMSEYAVCFTAMNKEQRSHLARLLGSIKLEQVYMQQP